MSEERSPVLASAGSSPMATGICWLMRVLILVNLLPTSKAVTSFCSQASRRTMIGITNGLQRCLVRSLKTLMLRVMQAVAPMMLR